MPTISPDAATARAVGSGRRRPDASLCPRWPGVTAGGYERPERRRPPPGARTREPDITIADLGEFALIRRLTADLAGNESVLVGPGDDAAVLGLADGRVVVTTDLMLEGRHFRRDWSTAEDVGHKAAARNLADIAAMGATPIALVVGFGAPGDTDLAWADGLMAGLRAEAGTIGAAIVGGDITASDSITIAVTALGELGGRSPVLQSGARPGDLVAVAGRLGWAAAGFAVLGRGFRSPVQVVNAHRRPEPPYAAGPEAARAGATSLTDVSDGLIADLGHIADASGVRINLATSQIEIAAKLAEVGAALNVDPLTWVLTGGDDYALAGTFPNHTSLPPGWTVIGQVFEGGEETGVRVDGRTWAETGHEHFR